MTHGPRTAAQYTGCAVLGPLAGPGARPGKHSRERPSRRAAGRAHITERQGRRAAGRAHIVESGRAAGPQGAHKEKRLHVTCSRGTITAGRLPF